VKRGKNAMNHSMIAARIRLLAGFALLFFIPDASAANPTNLRGEYRVNPHGIDAQRPRLSWLMEDSGQKTEVRGQRAKKS
jgi:hypothetical protein